MRGLTVLLTQPEALRPALELAAAAAALGGRARLFAQGAAVAALASPIRHAADDRHAGAGLPPLAGLFEEALALGVEIIACQTGLALCGLAAGALDGRILCAGLVGVLGTLEDDRLVTL